MKKTNKDYLSNRRFCINNFSCPCPMLLKSGKCTDKGMKALKKKEDEGVREQARADLEQYCRDMKIDLGGLKEMNRVKPLEVIKKVVRTYSPLRSNEQVRELSL